MKRTLSLISAWLLLILIVYGAYSFGRQGYEIEWRSKVPRITVTNQVPADQTLDFSLFWRAYELLNQKFIDGPLDAKKLLYGSAQGLFNATGDPYTAFLPPPENKQVNQTLAGKYEGIGAELGLKDNLLTVVAPLDGSPAKAVGIEAGDKILKIDGRETVGTSLSEAVSKIRGPEGTKVTLTILKSREAAAATLAAGAKKPVGKDLTIIRAPIKVESLKWEDKGEGVVYLRLSQFGESTNLEWDKAVAAILAKVPNLKAVVLDLRRNPGGYFGAAIHLASEFIKDGVVSYQEFANQVRQEYRVDHLGRLTNVAGVVLIDKGSASASEIVAGALKERRGFKVVGEKSFGKGSVQDTENFEDGSGVHITIARWLTPSGFNLHNQGIEPDLKVEISDEDVNNGKDPQLDQALAVAREF